MERPEPASILVIVGAAMLLAAAFVGWYQIQDTGPGVANTITLNPGTSETIGCSGSACPTSESSGTVSYSSLDQNSTGALYLAVEVLCVIGFLGGLGAGLYAMAVSRERPGRLRVATASGIIATLCALLAPIALVIAQPSALTADTHGGMVPSTGPWVSFVGTDSVSSMTLTWGPYFGWYLAWMAGALLLIGAVLFGRKYVAQRALEAPEAAEAPMGGDGELYGASGPYRAPTEPADYGADPGPDPPQV